MLRYGIEIADALDKAHRTGIIHRDLKPGNVMLTHSGAKLLDFGLAKAMDAALVASTSPQSVDRDAADEPLTAEGTLLGTFCYMAPEQVESAAADARTDIFAFGCVLYEMPTGRRAFDAASRAGMIAQIIASDPPPISTLRPMTPVVARPRRPHLPGQESRRSLPDRARRDAGAASGSATSRRIRPRRCRSPARTRR